MRAWVPTLLLIVAGLGAGAVGALRTTALEPPSWELAAPLATLPGGAASFDSYDTIVPPILMPRDVQERFEARIVYRLEAGSRIDVELSGSRPRLVWPVGAQLARLEIALGSANGRSSDRIADVRATRVTEHGLRFSSYRPLDLDARQLFGAEWESDDPVGLAGVRRAFAITLESGHGFLEMEAGSRPERRTSSIERHARLLDCASCHDLSREEHRAPGPDHTLRRATDAHGFYVPLYALSDRAPLETYRPIDPNAAEPFVRAQCGDTALELDGRTALRCPDGRVPELALDVVGGLRARNPHVLAVCASRRRLASFLTERARAAFAGELDACSGASS